MALKEDCMKIGEKYYLNSDIQKIFDSRIKNIIPEETE